MIQNRSWMIINICLGFFSLKTMGRDKRLEYAASFEISYFFRLLYYAGTQYPIMGALRWLPHLKFIFQTLSSNLPSKLPPVFFKTLILLNLRMSHPYRYELYKRVDDPSGKEKYIVLSTYPKRPSIDEINDAFDGKPRYN